MSETTAFPQPRQPRQNRRQMGPAERIAQPRTVEEIADRMAIDPHYEPPASTEAAESKTLPPLPVQVDAQPIAGPGIIEVALNTIGSVGKLFPADSTIRQGTEGIVRRERRLIEEKGLVGAAIGGLSPVPDHDPFESRPPLRAEEIEAAKERAREERKRRELVAVGEQVAEDVAEALAEALQPRDAGGGDSFPCDESSWLDRRGRRCGGRSAAERAGGREPGRDF